MANDDVKQQVHDVLKSVYFSSVDDMVDVSDGPDDSIHVVIVSRKFDGQRMKEKHDLIWGLLTRELPEDIWSRVSLAVARTPFEIKSGI